MTYRIIFVFVTVLVSLNAVSCVQDVILDARDEPQVVVDCILCDEPIQNLHLVYTKGASRTEAPELKDAVATLTDLTEGKEVGRFQRTADGPWQLAYAAIPEHSYRLEVSVPNHEPIWAEQTMPEAINVEVEWHSWDPVNRDNNVGYLFKIRNSKSPVWFYGVDYPTVDSAGEITKYLRTNSETVDSFNEVNMRDFAGDANGAYLWGANSSGFRITSYPALKDLPWHKSYLRFPASDILSDTTLYISGSFHGYISDHKDFMHTKLRPAELHYFSASEDYDRFISDSYKLMDLKTSTDMADIFIRDNVYTNIHGAIGLFGGKTERMLEWEGRDTWQASGYFLLAGFVTNSYKFVTTSYGLFDEREAVLNCRPFELLHYEYYRLRSEREYGEYPDLLPDWAPELLPGFDYMENQVTSFYLETIEDQEHWDTYGLGDSSEIDFTKKKVLVCVVSYLNEIPILIGYDHLRKGDAYTNLQEQKNKYAPVILVLRTPAIPSIENYSSLFRCALLIDKDDPIVDNIWSYQTFTYNLYIESSNEPFIDNEYAACKSMAESLAWNYP